MIRADINQYDIWLADLNPQRSTEVGKTRPVLIVQTDLLNSIHDAVIICPITSKKSDSKITKVKVEPSKNNGLEFVSWVIVDQIRAIENGRLVKKLGSLANDTCLSIQNSLKIILEIA